MGNVDCCTKRSKEEKNEDMSNNVQQEEIVKNSFESNSKEIVKKKKRHRKKVKKKIEKNSNSSNKENVIMENTIMNDNINTTNSFQKIKPIDNIDNSVISNQHNISLNKIITEISENNNKDVQLTNLYFHISSFDIVSPSLESYGEVFTPIVEIKASINNKAVMNIKKECKVNEKYNNFTNDCIPYQYIHSNEQITSEFVDSLDVNNKIYTNNGTIVKKYLIDINNQLKIEKGIKISIAVINKSEDDNSQRIVYGTFDINISAIVSYMKMNGDFNGLIPIRNSKMFTVAYLRAKLSSRELQMIKRTKTTKANIAKENYLIEDKDIFPISHADIDYIEYLSQTAMKTLSNGNPITKETKSSSNPLELYQLYKECIENKNIYDLYEKVLIPLNEIDVDNYANMTMFFDEYIKEMNENKEEEEEENEDNRTTIENFISNILSVCNYNLFIGHLLLKFVYQYVLYSYSINDFEQRNNFPFEVNSLIEDTFAFIGILVNKMTSGKEIEEFKSKNELCVIYAIKLLILLTSSNNNALPLNLSLIEANEYKKNESQLISSNCKVIFANIETLIKIIERNSLYLNNSDIVTLVLILIRRVLCILNTESEGKENKFYNNERKIQFIQDFRIKHLIDIYHCYSYIILNLQIIFYLSLSIEVDSSFDLIEYIPIEDIKSLFISNSSYRLKFNTLLYKSMNNFNLCIIKNFMLILNNSNTNKEVFLIILSELSLYYTSEDKYSIFIEEKYSHYELHYLITSIGVELSKYNNTFLSFISNAKLFNNDIINFIDYISKGDISVNSTKKDNYIYNIHKQRGKKSQYEEIAQILMLILENSLRIWIAEMNSEAELNEEILNKLGLFGSVEQFTMHISEYEQFLEGFKVYSKNVLNLVTQLNYQLDQ